jgi:hypothetical protein
MNTDDPVREALEALRADDASLRVSSRVEEAVFAAFDAPSKQGANVVLRVALAAAAILVAAVSYVLVISPSKRVTAPEPPAAASATAVVDSVPSAAPVIDVQEQRPAATSDNAPVRARATESGRPRTIRPYVPVDSAYVQTVQARIPRSYLPLLGIPVIDPEAGGTVGIEILVGEYGQRQAIRILQ